MFAVMMLIPLNVRVNNVAFFFICVHKYETVTAILKGCLYLFP